MRDGWEKHELGRGARYAAFAGLAVVAVGVVWVFIMIFSVEDIEDAVRRNAIGAAWKALGYRADSSYHGPPAGRDTLILKKKPDIEPIIVGYTADYGGPRDSVRVRVWLDRGAGVESTTVTRQPAR